MLTIQYNSDSIEYIYLFLCHFFDDIRNIYMYIQYI